MSNLLAPLPDQQTIDQLEAAYAAPSATRGPVVRAATDAEASITEDPSATTSVREYVAMTIALTMVFGFVVLVVLTAMD